MERQTEWAEGFGEVQGRPPSSCCWERRDFLLQVHAKDCWVALPGFGGLLRLSKVGGRERREELSISSIELDGPWVDHPALSCGKRGPMENLCSLLT